LGTVRAGTHREGFEGFSSCWGPLAIPRISFVLDGMGRLTDQG
jgi:hypothetical protein